MTATITNRQKAALVILALEEGLAVEVMRNLEADELRSLVKCVETLDGVDPMLLDSVFVEFSEKMRIPMLPRSGGAYVRNLAVNALGESKAREILDTIPKPKLAPIDVIRTARTATLAELLAQEHPQIAAAILSQLGRVQAGQILLVMPQETQVDLLKRVAQLTEVPTDEILLASQALVKALALAGGLTDASKQQTFDGIEFTAELLKQVPSEDSERLIGAIEEADSQLGPKIREGMFRFEDLKKITGRGLQNLMREVPSETMLLALKTSPEEMRDHFLSAVSSRAAEQMREDLQLLPPTRLSEVERAQREIVECAMRLASDGQITLPTGGGEQLV